MSEGYIELGRTFHELSLKGGDSDEFDYRHLRVGKGLRWQDLLARYRTVILSEAGAGKTEEIRHSAQTLRNEGKSAFFLRLEHVADDFEIAFEEGNLAEFDQWLASDEEGWLFLDSVDEARLREPKDFERAIRKIGGRLSVALQRTHMVLTSRGTAWRPVTDLKLCQQHLKYIEPAPADVEGGQAGSSGKEDNCFRIVALDDLGVAQVEIFAKARGIADPKPLVDAIERADAWSMAARPDDLTELVEYWDKNKRIGNRLELIQSSIARRLAERDQNRDEALPLSIADAHMGARSVAAAATMTQESTIRVPDGSENTKGIAVPAVLPSWDSKKCAALLARPIFDEAIYQTVRFHHRTVREYLTAEWIKGLLERETSRRKIESLLFREQYGQEVIVPTMRPVLVWLILLDDKIRARALAISPELIFEGGEPKALPLATRQKILRDVCETMHTGITLSSTSDYRAVQRFADKDIAADVKALFAKYAVSDELQWFLLRMIWQGELSEALPEAKRVALNPKTGRYARIAAFRAVRAVGSDADKLEIREHFLKEASVLNREWLAELLEDLPPTQHSVEWILACIVKLKPKDRHSIDGLPQALDTFVQSLDPDLLAKLLEGLNVLLSKRPVVERRYCEISKRHGWLIKSAAQAAERLILARHPAALQIPALSVLQKLPSAQQYRDWDLRDIRSNIPSLVPAWSELNQALFWYEAGQARRFRQKKKKERVKDFWQVSLFGSYSQFGPDDFDRIVADIGLRSLRDDRLVALSLAFHLYVQAQRPRKWREALRASVAKIPALRSALQNHLHPPPPTKQQKQWRRQNAEYHRRQKKREVTDAEREQIWKGDLAKHIAQLRNHGLLDPTAVTNHQHYLHEKMRELDSQSSHWTAGNWQVLKAEFGEEIARAFRDGVVAYWRRYTPKLRSEGKADNRTPFSVIFGLTGVNIEARETENWASMLKESEAEIAFRYAMDELNGFPDWMPSLFQAFPELTVKLLLREVDRDLRIEKANVDSHYVLSGLSWSGSWARPSIGGGIFARLKAREPKNLSNLGYMLNIVHDAGISSDDIARLAELRSADRRLAHAARWYAVWTGVEPDNAIPALATRLNTIKAPTKQTSFAMQFITHLLGGRRSTVKNGEAFRTPEHLKNLYTLMHRYIREKEDIQRAGKGVYSPGLRDEAQDARSQLFSLLKEIPGKKAYLALMELAQLHPEPSSRPWMRHHAKTKAELDADLTPWTIEQTLEFRTAIERTPANHRELSELAEMRFLDLKDNLEHGDSSIADILVKGATRETSMRKYIGDWLRERAQGRYVIPQEEELADDKRMDLRMHGMGFDGPVPVELKLADKWTGSKLFERLENQLCGDYLRDNRSSRGIFVLVYRGEKQSWELPGTGKVVDFAGLIETLQSHWLAISHKFSNVDDVRVIGIDLTRRSAP
ncbi:hypothetical protein [Mesorhizobium sp.]|uniref:hypothetical protein n=1 Tax=Mesorhizobium sp. TaxID=1871066 RepID=UPI0011FF2FBC|nr:hypothetical protein [Mesorhizobium sp.]TIL69590.1 MAG: hypothetical protein E5Y77_00350 [Mesorhizobium sp.]